jgi:two-component system, chemotaxis family, response regulator Rcp1
MRVLLVEDTPGAVFLFREALREPSMPPVELLVAYDGETALEIAQRSGLDFHLRRPDLIVLDLSLPRRNGFEVLQVIRANSALTTMPICVLTTSARQVDVEMAYDLGANAYILKPDSFGPFVDTVRNAIRFWSLVVRPSTMDPPARLTSQFASDRTTPE